MDMRQIAEDVLEAIGGSANITSCDVCMTRLRILTADPSLVDTDALAAARGVLGFVRRGTNGIEVVFGPGKVMDVYEQLTSLIKADLTSSESDENTNATDSSDELSPAAEPTEKADVSDKPQDTSNTSTSVKPHVSQNEPAIRVRVIPNALQDAAQNTNTDSTPKSSDISLDELLNMLSAVEEKAEEEAQLATEEPADETKKTIVGLGQSIVSPEEQKPNNTEHLASDARLLVINGPNINMLGIREPDIYGRDTYQVLLATCQEAAAEAGFSRCTCFQSNHEGDIVDAIQDAYDIYDGIVINPGAYTHTSVAILDAAKAVGLPMVEVHISKIDERESFRQVSYIRAACFETIIGMGIEGYRKAIFDLAEYIGIR